MGKSRLPDLLKVGKQNARNWKSLANELNLNNKRSFYHALEKARENVVVLSDGRENYFLPDVNTEEGRKEIKEFIDTTSAKARSLFLSLHSARNVLNECRGQLELDGTNDSEVKNG